MSKNADALPHVLSLPSTRRVPDDLSFLTVTELRKPARIWLSADQSKLAKERLVAALRKALDDDTVAKRVLSGLSPAECAVLAAYRRYGGSVDGEVIRLDLMARGLLQIQESRLSDTYTRRQWTRNLVKELANCWILLPEQRAREQFYYGFYGDDPHRSFEYYSVHARLAALVEPAGPPPWSIPPATGTPHAITRHSPAEVALNLSRVFAYVAARGGVKVRMDGVLATPTRRAMSKALPFGDDSELAIPDPISFHVALLRSAGVIRIDDQMAVVEPSGMARMLALSDAWQARFWARGWLHARSWFDGVGAPESSDLEHGSAVQTVRAVVAWALGSLAHGGDHWYELSAFVSALDALQGDISLHLPYDDLKWNPEFTPEKEKAKDGGSKAGIAGQRRVRGPRRELVWYANAVMVTLVGLGLVERGRLGRAGGGAHVFRLTTLGRAVFGAPEVAPPAAGPAPGGGRFLVVQPNFDLLAYVDQADAASAVLLGRIAESATASSGPVQTFRLTQASVYQAQEGGLGHDQIVAFLEQHAQGTLPANVLRSLADWSQKRESLVIRTGATLLGFPSEADRDAYLKGHPGTACGTRFVIGAGPAGELPELAGALAMDHLLTGRRTLELDEHGRIQTSKPLDIVQRARLNRFAKAKLVGWRITADSIRQATAGGVKPGTVHRWLLAHLAKPMPPLTAHAVDAWMGKTEAVELADAVLLHVPGDELFRAIAASPRLQPYLLGSPGSHWLVVRREARKELAAALEELGFMIDRQLILNK